MESSSTFTHKLKKLGSKLCFKKSLCKVYPSHWTLKFNEPQIDLSNNKISTGIYNVFNFLPKSLAFQFSRVVNIYFLVISTLQLFPEISATNGKPIGFLPLSIIMLASSIKELVEDCKRHKSDRVENNKKTLVHKDGHFVECRWGDLKVGHIIKIQDNEVVPADILLLKTTLKNGLCFIETMNLDGETALKSKFVHKELIPLMDTEEQIMNSRNQFTYERPNEYLYKFVGCVEGKKGRVAMNDQNFVLRGCTLKNTGSIYGVVSYTGHSTKIMLNSTKSKAKTSKLEKDMGRQIMNIFLMLLAFCSFAALYSAIWFRGELNNLDYLDPNQVMTKENSFLYILFIQMGSWLILLSRFVPISLIVNIELVRLAQSFFITYDSEMTQEGTGIQACVQSPNLTDELGQIEYILSDKTGTLTKNMMNFKKISIGGELYGDKISFQSFGQQEIPHVDFYDQRLIETLMDPTKKNHAYIKETIFLLALCHTAMIQEKDGKKSYNTASPDELALVNFAKFAGVEFLGTDENDNINITFKGEQIQYKLLQIFEFNSDRKRMSIIVKTPEGKIMLYTKGADTTLLSRMDNNDTDNDYYILLSHHHLHSFSTEGLRTLILAKKELDPKIYEEWKKVYDEAQSKIEGRDEIMELLQSELEVDLKILGVSAVEDKLQDEVASTIAQFKETGIKVWVLTGDKVETAINIGFACRVLDDNMTHLQLLEKTNEEVTSAIEKMIAQVTDSCKKTRFSLVVSGDALIYAMKPELSKKLLMIAKKCRVLIACRVSPKQKQQFVKLLRQDNPKVSTLAIGDGANDVNMITAASVGVGICGLEGQQAARASDFAIGEFKLLKRLLFYHGRENYRRNSYLIIYNFYKNILFGASFFWFGFYSGFSGTTFFDKFLTEFFNTLFTSIPIMLYAIFDHEYSPENLVQTPKLYLQGIKSKIFNNKRFFQWVLWGFMGSAFLTICALNFYENKVATNSNGKHSGIYGVGMFIFAGAVWLANIKIFAIAHTFNTLTLFFGFGCCLLYGICFIIASQFTFTDVYGFSLPILLSPYFYTMLFIVTLPSFLATLGYRIYKHLTHPIKVCKAVIKLSEFVGTPTCKPLYDDTASPNNKPVYDNISTLGDESPSRVSTPSRILNTPSKFSRSPVRIFPR